MSLQLLPRKLFDLAFTRLEDQFYEGLDHFYVDLVLDDVEPQQVVAATDWLLFAYQEPSSQLSLAEILADERKGLTKAERRQARLWSQRAVPGFFHVVKKGAGKAHLRRLGDHAAYVVTDQRLGGLEAGDLILAWLLPLESSLCCGLYVGLVSPEAHQPLEHLLNGELTLLQRQQPKASWANLYRQHWPRLLDQLMMAETWGEACLHIEVNPTPRVVERPAENPISELAAVRFADLLIDGLWEPGSIEAGLRLYWDAVTLLEPRLLQPNAFLGALLYLFENRVQDDKFTQREAAELAGASVSAVSKWARQIDQVLAIEPYDVRYVDLVDPAARLAERHQYLQVLGEVGALVGAEPSNPVDHYVVLGHEALARRDFGEAVQLFEAGVAEAEQILGKAFFEEHKGSFWGLPETRPYMRARAGLADALWEQGQHEAAISHYDALLELDPMDHQGNRFDLANVLLTIGDDERLAHLVVVHGDDTATMRYTSALLAFRRKGADEDANASLDEALAVNLYVPTYLLGRRSLPSQPPLHFEAGSKGEAEIYVYDHLKHWQATPGALDWLASRL